MPRCVVLALLAVLSHSLFPPLNIVGDATISGISSGADTAVQFHLGNSDLVNGSAIFAGQAFGCAVMKMDGEAEFSCAAQPAGAKGPGCVGVPWGPAPCIGCAANMTVAYDHCKTAAGAALTQVSKLVAYARALEASGAIPPLANLANDPVYLYRGTLDTTYEAGSVNQTLAVFSALGVTDTSFEASIPSGHCWATADPAIDPSTCGGKGAGPPAMENCGYDGAGAALQHLYRGALVAPTSLAAFDPASLLPFAQADYMGSAPWTGQGRTGYLYAPAACRALAPCRLHIALHGCGMSASNKMMGLNFTLHTGLNAWAEVNNFTILYPQQGGYIDFNVTAPSAQLGGQCFDGYVEGRRWQSVWSRLRASLFSMCLPPWTQTFLCRYGQTGTDFATTNGPQMLVIRNMISALRA